MSILLIRHRALFMTSFVLLLLSIICQIVSGMRLTTLMKEADQMQATENKLLKHCKLKYISCYRLGGKVKNTSVFVDKFMQRISCMGISIRTLTHLSGQLMLFSVLVQGIIICICLAAGDTLFQMIPYYSFSFLSLYLYFAVSGAAAVGEKRRMLRTGIEDYLENHLLPTLENEQEEKVVKPVREDEGKKPVSETERAELESLLRELLA